MTISKNSLKISALIIALLMTAVSAQAMTEQDQEQVAQKPETKSEIVLAEQTEQQIPNQQVSEQQTPEEEDVAAMFQRSAMRLENAYRFGLGLPLLSYEPDLVNDLIDDLRFNNTRSIKSRDQKIEELQAKIQELEAKNQSWNTRKKAAALIAVVGSYEAIKYALPVVTKKAVEQAILGYLTWYNWAYL